jgi:hypothetical protein
MKKLMFLLLTAALMICGTSTTQAQDAPAKTSKPRLTEEQIISHRTGRMVQTLMLDDATAAKFTPVYSQYLKEMMDCHKMTREAFKGKDKNVGGRTEAEIDQMIQNRFAQSRKMLDIREKYYGKFRKIVSAKQVLKIYQTEKQDQGRIKKEMQRRDFKKRQMRKQH